MKYSTNKGYKKNDRLTSLDLLVMLTYIFARKTAKRIFKRPSPSTSAKADAFYAMQVGGKVTQSLEKPMWWNCGYWKDGRTKIEACEAAARLLADGAQLGPQDIVLDCGFGYGDQDMLWCREYDVKKIVGVNVTKIHLETATKRVSLAGLQDRIEYHLESATELPFESNSFTKVLALESALHFDSREAFFEEAMRVLRPGGCLATLDMLPVSSPNVSSLQWWLQRPMRALMAIPESNMYDLDTYVRKLEKIGYQSVKAESIRDYVYPGAAIWKATRKAGQERLELSETEFNADNWLCFWRDTIGFEDYVRVIAYKPM